MLPRETSFDTDCRFTEVIEENFSTLVIHLNFSSLVYQISSKDTGKENKVFSLYRKNNIVQTGSPLKFLHLSVWK